MKRLADHLQPPYFAAVFHARRTNSNGELDGHVRTAQEMVALATRQPGFLGLETARNERGRAITVSYWKDLESIDAWRAKGEWAVAKRDGRDAWDEFQGLEVVRVR